MRTAGDVKFSQTSVGCVQWRYFAGRAADVKSTLPPLKEPAPDNDWPVVGLVEAILSCAYFNIGVCLRSDKITTSTMERSLLKNLGSWLGQTTLARNRPILQIMLDCKELLFQGYETGKLIAVTPFVAKILEGAKNSVVFRPRNPWTMGLMNVFRAVYEVEDLKMNIKFEIEVLCKNLGLKLEDIPLRPEILANRAPPTKERNPDFNIKASTATGTWLTQHPERPRDGPCDGRAAHRRRRPLAERSRRSGALAAPLPLKRGGRLDAFCAAADGRRLCR